jgi:hypothetical protein
MLLSLFLRITEEPIPRYRYIELRCVRMVRGWSEDPILTICVGHGDGRRNKPNLG